MALTKLLLVLSLLVLFSYSESYNILVIFNIPSKSIHLAAVSLATILAKKGHNVTLVTQYKYNEETQNIDHVFLKETAEENERIFVNMFDFEINLYSTFHQLELVGLQNCRLTFRDRAFKRLLKSNKKFDLLIVDSYVSSSLLYMSEYFNVPVILYSSFDSSYSTNPLFANPAPPSYVPNLFLKYSDEMSFLQRLENSFIFLLNEFLWYSYTIPRHDKLVKEFFPEAQHISKYLYKASIVLLNSDVSIKEAMPKTPGMIHIGGFHIRSPKPLPEDLENIMRNAENGVILFSLGSNIKSSQMPQTQIKAILNIFSRLKQTVIWKWEDEDLPGKPTNVVVRKWLPQTDILGHKNLKLFITHGGQHSIIETVYHGVPCVSLSVFMDQGANSFRASRMGYAEWIPYKEFTPEKFENAINQTLNDSRYREAARKRSAMMRDKMLTPQEKLVFWTEYVIRHEGAKHLQLKGLNLEWYQYLLLDVVFFPLICLILLMYIMKRFISSLLRKTIKNKTD